MEPLGCRIHGKTESWILRLEAWRFGEGVTLGFGVAEDATEREVTCGIHTVVSQPSTYLDVKLRERYTDVSSFACSELQRSSMD